MICAAPTVERPLNALTVDVEDYFQVSAFEEQVPRERWDAMELRVGIGTRRLLDLFDAHGVKATFFVLGWVAERCSDLLAEIVARDHELASHGYEHRRVTTLDAVAFRDDLRRAARAIEEASGVRVRGFRAPSFSISRDTLWAFDVLREEGYAYSSSVFPVRHDRYGIPEFPRHPVRLEGEGGRVLWELPMTTWRIFGLNVPAAGGGWLRALPTFVTHRAIRAANRAGRPAVVYVHPWELDPDQPHIPMATAASRLRHRLNLGATHDRLAALLERYRFGPVRDVLADLERG